MAWVVIASVCVVLALFALVAVGVFEWEARTKKEAKLQFHTTELRAALDTYRERLGQLAADPFFAATRPTLDAGPFLNPLVPWADGETRPSQLALDPALMEKFRQWGDEWPSRRNELDLARFDTSWLHELRQFGSWDLVEGSHLGRFRVIDCPCPDYEALRVWAKLHLLKGIEAENAGACGDDVRHFAWLSYTNETVLASMVALALLHVERVAFQACIARGITPSPGWQPVSWERAERFRRAVWTGVYLAYPASEPELFAEVLSAGEKAVGRNVALTERAFGVAALRSIGQELPWACEFERSLDKHSRLNFARLLLKNGSAAKDAPETYPPNFDWKPQASWLARVGGGIAQRLAPEFFRAHVLNLLFVGWMPEESRFRDVLGGSFPAE